jgi:hypothetical protein
MKVGNSADPGENMPLVDGHGFHSTSCARPLETSHYSFGANQVPRTRAADKYRHGFAKTDVLERR